jgi:hypothetical protein
MSEEHGLHIEPWVPGELFISWNMPRPYEWISPIHGKTGWHFEPPTTYMVEISAGTYEKLPIETANWTQPTQRLVLDHSDRYQPFDGGVDGFNMPRPTEPNPDFKWTIRDIPTGFWYWARVAPINDVSMGNWAYTSDSFRISGLFAQSRLRTASQKFKNSRIPSFDATRNPPTLIHKQERAFVKDRKSQIVKETGAEAGSDDVNVTQHILYPHSVPRPEIAYDPQTGRGILLMNKTEEISLVQWNPAFEWIQSKYRPVYRTQPHRINAMPADSKKFSHREYSRLMDSNEPQTIGQTADERHMSKILPLDKPSQHWKTLRYGWAGRSLPKPSVKDDSVKPVEGYDLISGAMGNSLPEPKPQPLDKNIRASPIHPSRPIGPVGREYSARSFPSAETHSGDMHAVNSRSEEREYELHGYDPPPGGVENNWNPRRSLSEHEALTTSAAKGEI